MTGLACQAIQAPHPAATSAMVAHGRVLGGRPSPTRPLLLALLSTEGARSRRSRRPVRGVLVGVRARGSFDPSGVLMRDPAAYPVAHSVGYSTYSGRSRNSCTKTKDHFSSNCTPCV